MGDCALMESLTVEGRAGPHRELRLLTYDRRAEAWTLALVDSGHGNLVTMIGREVEHGLEFTSTHMRRGRLLIDRIRLTRLDEDELEYRIETSSDGGAAWTTLAESRYRRVRPPER